MDTANIDLSIYTYGHIDSMYYILNGIAMLMTTAFATMLVNTIALSASAYYAIRAAYGSSTGAGRQHIMKIAGMIVVINALIVPKTSMSILDNVTKQREEVSNLPYGFALPVGMLESFGHALTAGFEQAFTPTGNTSYRDYGMIFGARLVRDARNWRIKSPELVYNMNSFIRGCVIRGVARGKYSLDDLFKNDKVWETVSVNASKLKEIEVKQGSNHTLMTCHDAVTEVISPAFTNEIENLVAKYAKKDFGLASNTIEAFRPRGEERAESYFKRNAAMAFESFVGSRNSAESSIKQYMMLNSLGDYQRTYGAARASMNQETNWRIAGDLAEEYLPMLLSVIKGMVYASFIFMVPLMLLAGGIDKYMKYLTIVVSLQLWPALNAVLNMFIDLYTSGTLQGLAAGSINYTNHSQVGDYSDKIVAIASGLQMTIPFLAFALVQGGVRGFIHLANSITGASNSASNMAANEVTSGNRSFDNVSVGNTQMAMNQGFKTDYNTSYRRGGHEMQLDSGGMERVTSGGAVLINEDASLTSSTGHTNFNLSKASNAQLSKNYDFERRNLDSKQAAFHESERATQTEAANMVVGLAKREQSGETFDYSKFGDQGKAVQKAVSNARVLHDKYNYGWDQIAEGSLKADGKVPLSPLAGGIAGAALDKMGAGVLGKLAPEINISADGKIAALNTSNQSVGDDNSLSLDEVSREDWSNIVKAGMSEEFGKSTGLEKNYSDNLTKAYEKQKSAETSMMTQSEKVEAYREAISRTESSDASMGRNMRPEVQSELMQRYGASSNEAHQMIESGDPRVGKVWNSIVENQVSSIVDAQMQARAMNLSDSAQQVRIDNANDINTTKIDKDYRQGVVDKAKSHGIDPNDANFINTNARDKATALMEQNHKEYEKTKQANLERQVARQEKIDEYEDNRMGQGYLGKKMGIGGPTNPSTIKKGNDEKSSNSSN